MTLPLAEGKTLVVALAAPAALEGRVVDARTLRPVPRAKVDARDGAFVRTVRARLRTAGTGSAACRRGRSVSRWTNRATCRS